MTTEQTPHPEKQSRTAMIGAVLAILGAGLMLGGMLGARNGLVPQLTGFGIANLGVLLAGIALLFSLIGVFQTRAPRVQGRGRAVVGILISLLAIAPLARQLPAALSVPPIHDITTDTSAPPAFRAILPLRAGAPNSAEYGGAEIAAQQLQAYPGIVPLQVDMPPSEAFARVQRAAAAANWQIVAADPGEGRLEAVDQTKWFGFKDDIVVVVRSVDGGGSQIDMRSVSRVGKSDLGTNARRIRLFLAAVESN